MQQVIESKFFCWIQGKKTCFFDCDVVVFILLSYEPTVIRCACGAEFETRSTKKDLRVEICSKCHPFFTGRQKLVDTGGRVDRFNKRFGLNNK